MSIHQKLSEIQAKLKAPKAEYNSFGKYKYRSAENVMAAIKPFLNGLSLVLTDEMVMIGERYYLKATAVLTDNESTVVNCAYAREPLLQKGMNDSQITGSASSYARKYALGGLFLLDDNPDPDSQDNTQGKEPAQQNHQPNHGNKYIVPFGKTKGKHFDTLAPDEMGSMLTWCKSKNEEGKFNKLIAEITEYMGQK